MKGILIILIIYVNIYADLSFNIKNQPLKDENNIKVYTVKSGDNLFKIAKSFNIKVRDILIYNFLENEDNIYIGQNLVIPISYKEAGFLSISDRKKNIDQNKKTYDNILKYLDSKKKLIKYKKNNLLFILTKEQKINFINNVKDIINENFDSDQDFFLHLIFAIIYSESSFNYKVLGDHKKSVGLMQVNKETVRHIENNNQLSNQTLNTYLSDPLNNIQYALIIIKQKVKDLRRILKRIDKDKYKKFIEVHSSRFKGLEKEYVRFFPVVSMYNGGIKNYKYVNKVFREISKIKKMGES